MTREVASLSDFGTPTKVASRRWDSWLVVPGSTPCSVEQPANEDDEAVGKSLLDATRWINFIHSEHGYTLEDLSAGLAKGTLNRLKQGQSNDETTSQAASLAEGPGSNVDLPASHVLALAKVIQGICANTRRKPHDSTAETESTLAVAILHSFAENVQRMVEQPTDNPLPTSSWDRDNERTKLAVELIKEIAEIVSTNLVSVKEACDGNESSSRDTSFVLNSLQRRAHRARALYTKGSRAFQHSEAHQRKTALTFFKASHKAIQNLLREIGDDSAQSTFERSDLETLNLNMQQTSSSLDEGDIATAALKISLGLAMMASLQLVTKKAVSS